MALTKAIKAVIQGSPVSATYEPVPAEMTTLLTEINLTAAAALDGVNWLADAALATTANITLSGEQTIDGTLTSASRVLVKDQTDATENGVYVTGAGAWTRATDADTTAEIARAYVRVSGGTANEAKRFAVSGTPTLGTDNVTWDEAGYSVELATLEAALFDELNGAVAAAAVGYPLYGSTALGLAGTSDTEGFSVLGDALALYVNNAGVADLQGSIPLSTVTDALDTRLDTLEGQTLDTRLTTAEGEIDTAQSDITALEGLVAAGAVRKPQVACATTANITLSGEQTLDGVLTSASRVLVKSQTAPAENGIYVSAAGAWARAADMNTAGEVVGALVYVAGGTVNGGTSYYTGSTVTTLGTDAIDWQLDSSQSALQDQIDTLDAAVEYGTGPGLIITQPSLDLLGAEIGTALDFSLQSASVRDFANTGNLYSGSPDGLLTIARASVASYIDADGVMKYALANKLRFDHDPSGALGLLVEPAATNLALYSEQMLGNSWSPANATVVDNTDTAPDGTVTMESIVEDTTSGAHQLLRAIGGITSGVPYWAMCFLKRGDNRYAMLANNGGGIATADRPTGVIDFDTGEFFPVNPFATAAGPNAPVVMVRDCGNDIYLVGVKTTTTSTANLSLYLYGSDGPAYADRTYAGASGGVAMKAWGGQVVQSAQPLSYIPTVASTVTRNADNVTLAVSAMPWSATVGTVYLKARTPWAAGTNVLWQADDGSEDNRLRIERSSSNNLRFIVTSGGVEQANLDLGVVPHNHDFQVTVSWALNNFSASLDGGAIVSDTSGSLPSGITTMRFGSSFTGEHWSRYIQKFIHTPRRVL